MIVQYMNRQTKYPVKPWRQLLDQVLPAVFSHTGLAAELARDQIRARVSVMFAGPRLMRRLNRETRAVDSLTDVLSFPLLNMKNGRLPGQLSDHDFDLEAYPENILPLGDLVLSLDRAFSQAASYGHSREREVAFLAVHGLLHLLGYDHQDAADEQVMLSLQHKVMEAAGLPREYEGENHE